MKNFFKQFFYAFILMFIYLLINSLLNEILFFTKYSSIVSSFITLLIFIIYFRKNLMNDLKNLRKIKLKTWVNYTLFFIICYVSVVILDYYLTIFVGNMATNEQLVENSILNNPKLYFWEVVIIAPFMEELLCRLNFRRAFRNKWIFTIFTGLFFASLHLLSASSTLEILFIIPYFIMGFYLGFVYYDSDSIITSIIYHFSNNLIAFIILIIGSIL